MKKTLHILIFLLLISPIINSQNIGQEGDTLVNYIDINGFKQGFWQKKYYSGKVKYKGYFKNDKPIGEFKRYYENGKPKAIMNYNENITEAAAILFNNKGEKIASGKYLNEKKEGLWKYYQKDTILMLEENYKNGERVGLIRKYFSNGNVYDESYFYNGIRDSIWKQYYINGQLLMHCFHADGVRTGDFEAFFASGKIQITGQYENDRKQGKWTIYNENGTISKELIFKDDIAENQEELDKEEQEFIQKMEDGKGEIVDPEDYLENPEMYIRKSRQY